MEEVHDRMPVILKKENEAFWTDPNVDDSDALLQMLLPYTEVEMEKYIVSTAVNSPKLNDKSLLNQV